MKDARVWGALKHHAERAATNRTCDVTREARAVAGLHEDERVFGDRILRVGHRSGPQRVISFNRKGRGTAYEANTPAGRLAGREHHAYQRVAVPRRAERLVLRSRQENGIALRRDVLHVQNRLAGAATNGTSVA